MLTVEGADAAGLAGVVGELRAGMAADVVVLDTSGPHWWPRRGSWVESVVASATAADVRHVLVDGRVVATGGVSVTRADGPTLDQAATRIAGAMGWR
jgi:5-methylthioadenosine/S-adenosylhomocysteine deaminase